MSPASKRSESGGYNIPQQAVNPISRLVETPDIMASHGEGVWYSSLNLEITMSLQILAVLFYDLTIPVTAVFDDPA